MTPDDIIDLLAAIQAVDHRTIGEADVIVWHDIIGELPKDLAMRAAREHFRECPGVYLEPGHIYQRVRDIRQDLFQRQPLADIEAHNDRIDARLAPKIFELGEAKSVDRALKPYHRPKFNPLNVPCPHCHASVSRRCVSGRDIMRGYHPSRLEAAASPPRNQA